MNDNFQIQGTGNIGIQNVGENATLNVTQILVKSFEYNDLLDKIHTKQKLFDRTPEDEIEERLQLSADINQLKKTFEQFKRDVTALAETFNKLEINTDRLRRAKEYFEKGEIGEARAVLETELEQMQDEQTHLLKQKEHYETEVLPNLINNSEEFYLLAMATQADYDNPNRFNETCRYFEESIESYSTKDNILQYAKFLQEHFDLDKAESLYHRLLNNFSSALLSKEQAIILNNLGVLYENKNDFQKALNFYNESLSQFQLFSKVSPEFEHQRATVLRNLAILYRDNPENLQDWNKSNSGETATRLFNEAITIYQKLFEENPNIYLPKLAAVHNSIAKLKRKQNDYEKALEHCEQSLKITAEFNEIAPKSHPDQIALSLKRLADLHSEYAKYRYKAYIEYKKAIEIWEQLAKENPVAYSLKLASALCGLAILCEYDNEVNPLPSNLDGYRSALVFYNKALNIYCLKVKESPKKFSPVISKINYKLSKINALLGRNQKQVFDLSKTSYIVLTELNLNPFDENWEDCSSEMF